MIAESVSVEAEAARTSTSTRVAIVDDDMADVDGVRATRELRTVRPTAHVVVFSSSCDDEAVAAGFRAAGAIEQFDKTEIRELVAFVGAVGGTRQLAGNAR